ncbi:hypothetical protein E1265_19575 [Streptomyces sp. 8K308]|uniref:hypothetical protein n=1 Tax=Streptomyces sp. 8K308 TaxID=2530388 RepID=UPI001050CBE1|nr:hypothetical protein [Streptomyces sp. 8K308]TDC20943.1 hypothetical protein E1265_19575 [Streptomyces sp. 8K308]
MAHRGHLDRLRTGSGVITWTGTNQAYLGFTLEDYPEVPSYSQLHVSYEVFVDGQWEQRILHPDPVLLAANGQSQDLERNMTTFDPLRNVMVRLCSWENENLHCTDWS